MATSRGRGSSLIEVLVAVSILGGAMIGILQIFSVSLMQSRGSAARTQLMYKCQQVAEVIRMSQHLAVQGAPAFAANSGIGYPLAVVDYRALPYDTGDTTTDATHVGAYAFWGPDGANVVEKPRDAYRLFYTVESMGGAGYRVRVSAYPADSPDLPGTVVNPSARYLGPGAKKKVVEYVAQISSS